MKTKKKTPRLRLYLVVYSDSDGGSKDWFVTARSHREAFLEWKVYHLPDKDEKVWVHQVPRVARSPGMMPWHDDEVSPSKEFTT